MVMGELSIRELMLGVGRNKFPECIGERQLGYAAMVDDLQLFTT